MGRDLRAVGIVCCLLACAEEDAPDRHDREGEGGTLGGAGAGGAGDGGGGGGGAAGGGGEGGGGTGCRSDAGCDASEVCVARSCIPRCDPDAQDPGACPQGELCRFLGRFDASHEPLGACTPPNGGGTAGDACGEGAPCEHDHACLVGPGGGVCHARCAAGAGTCPAGLRCASVSASGQSTDLDRIGVCAPGRCLRDDDCGPDQVCAATRLPEGELDTACVLRQGDGGAGARCDADDDCASGLCLDGFGVCHGVCDRSSECGDGLACLMLGFEDGARSIALPACLERCIDDASCSPGGACAVATSRRGAAVAACVAARGNVRAGGACRDDDDCSSGLCVASHDGSTGYCDGGCDADDDCGPRTECAPASLDSAGPDEQWGTADDWTTLMRCRGEPCSSSGSCGDWACRPGLEGDPADVVMRCTPPAGAGLSGDACRDGCASGLCIPPVGSPPEHCSNGRDDDGDGRTDCDDPACFHGCHREMDCADGLDDDEDGATDCEDADCAGDCEREICRNGVDDDGDGLVDCDDPDCCFVDWDGVCAGKGACSERACANGLDDDGDGTIDCADLDCRPAAGCDEARCAGGSCCTNGIDDDGDGLTDCADRLNCGGNAACREVRCADGLDDDADGEIDCHDADCRAVCAEAACAGGSCCSNGLDDDGNGRIDCQDEACAVGDLCNEAACAGADCCEDGLDGDGDGRTDCADPDCWSQDVCDESEGSFPGSCTDGVDQDGDGLTDCADTDCHWRGDCRTCFEACAVDADCAGGRCVPQGAGVRDRPYEPSFEYVNACAP